jgi:hypothetical protein
MSNTATYQLSANDGNNVVFNIDVETKPNTHCKMCLEYSESQVLVKAKRILKNLGLNEEALDAVSDSLEIVKYPDLELQGKETEHYYKLKTCDICNRSYDLDDLDDVLGSQGRSAYYENGCSVELCNTPDYQN